MRHEFVLSEVPKVPKKRSTNEFSSYCGGGLSVLRLMLILGLISLCSTVYGVDQNYIRGMAEAVCRDQAHMQVCFERNEAACLTDAQDALWTCVSILPQRPTPKASVEAELADPKGAGAWGISLGHCAEISMAKNRKFRDPTCTEFFEKRTAEASTSPFQFNLERVRETSMTRMQEYRVVVVKQIFSYIFFGLGLPLFVAYRLMRRKVPEKYPKMMALGLAVVGFLSTVLVAPFAEKLVFGSSLFAESIRIMGDNPGAVSAMMMSWLVITPAYWVGISLLYSFIRRRAAKTRDPKTLVRPSA